MRQLWEEFDEEEEYELRECSESSCGHFDSLNQCCWLSWKNKREGDLCDYNFSTQPYGDFSVSSSKQKIEEVKSDG